MQKKLCIVSFHDDTTEMHAALTNSVLDDLQIQVISKVSFLINNSVLDGLQIEGKSKAGFLIITVKTHLDHRSRFSLVHF